MYGSPRSNPWDCPLITQSCTVYENQIKSLIQLCERSELRLHFKKAKIHLLHFTRWGKSSDFYATSKMTKKNVSVFCVENVRILLKMTISDSEKGYYLK